MDTLAILKPIFWLTGLLLIANLYGAQSVEAGLSDVTEQSSLRQSKQTGKPNRVEITQKAVFQVRLGAVESIMLSPEWYESEVGQSERHCFYKARKNWSDCKVEFIVKAPYRLDVSNEKILEEVLATPDHQLLLSELMSLRNLLDPGVLEKYLHYEERYKNHELVGSTEHIDDKKVLIITEKGKRSGPCQFLPDGSSRMPLLNYQSCAVYVLLPKDRLQKIICDADIMGDANDCLSETRKIIDTLKWSRLDQ